MAPVSPSRIENLRNIFFLVFLVLVATIIFTPLLVTRGFPFVAEETLESILLFVQVTLAWYVFQLYEKTVRRREKEIEKLENEYQKREKQLLETFAYLGKINVQISYIKDFLKKLKAPKNKKEMKEYLDDILHMALEVSQKDWLAVRIINTRSLQTLSEYWMKKSGGENTEVVKVGNREILQMAGDKKFCNEKGYCVLASAGSRPEEEKAFLFFKENGEMDPEVMDFLKAAVNQCEIIHTLFVLGQPGG